MPTATNPYLLGASIGADGLTALLGAISAANQRKKNEELTNEGIQANKEADTRDLAFKESTLDPFRQQMSQAGAISKLDRLERGAYKPVKLQAAPGYEKYVPQMSGGFSYEKSPELVASAGALKRNVMGGNVAPSMTDPTNYGKTAALNLLSIAAAGKDPGTVSGGGGAPRTVASYTAGVPTRTAGGLGTSETRASDMSISDATAVVSRAIQSELGRDPQPGEVQAMLAGQGLKAGDRWVGANSLNFILNTLRSQAAQGPAAPSYTGRG